MPPIGRILYGHLLLDVSHIVNVLLKAISKESLINDTATVDDIKSIGYKSFGLKLQLLYLLLARRSLWAEVTPIDEIHNKGKIV